MTSWLAVFMGGGLGACLRYNLGILIAHRFPSDFPYPTLCVNLLGAAVIGIITILLSVQDIASSHALKLFLVVGVLGGFTTFSAFSLESVLLFERHAYAQLVVYMAASTLGTVAVALAAMAITRRVIL